MTTDPIADALAADEPPVTIDQVLAIVDELANVSTPNPASGIVRVGLVTELRQELRPSLGSTGAGRGGVTRIPIDATALALWEDVTARVQALPIDLGDGAATKGSLEQILNTWARGLTAADAESRGFQRHYGYAVTGLSPEALRTMHRRLDRIRNIIDDHFNPPRRVEYPYCPECRNMHVLVEVDGEDVQQRALVASFWPTNPDRPAVATCAVCGATWTGIDSISNLNDKLNALAAVQEFNTKHHIGTVVTITGPGRHADSSHTVSEAELNEDDEAAVWVYVSEGAEELITLDRITPIEGDPS